MTIVLPPIVVTATEPGYPANPGGLPFPAPNPAVVFQGQMLERFAYYRQGLWREMLIKIANEQVTWGMTGGPAPGIVHDLQSVPFADSYLYFNPGLTSGHGLNYAQQYFHSGGVTSSPGLSGGDLTPVAAVGHFLYGKGTPTETSINLFGLNSPGISSAVFNDVLATAPIGTSPISIGSIPFTPDVTSWQLATWIDNLSLTLQGTLNKSPDGSYQFTGSVSAANHTYDSMPAGFKAAIGEAAANTLQSVLDAHGAMPFEVVIKGETAVTVTKELTPDEKAAYTDAVSFVSTANEHMLQKYGANLSKVAQDMQAEISGKKIRSYAEAMATFEKVSANPRMKLNALDTQAVVDALNALDKATFADNITRLGKAFGVVGKVVQAEAIREKTVSGFQTGDWKPLMLELEAMAVGTGAGILVATSMAFFFPVFASAAAGVVVVALMMAATAAYFDAAKVDEINNMILN